MSHMLERSDEQYTIFTRVAQERGQALGALLVQLAEELRDHDLEPHYYETDDWLRHLGVSEERIQQANARLAENEASHVK